MSETQSSKYLLSFDVEDWFHVENLSNQISRSNWDEQEVRVDQSTIWILDILDEYETKATFFVLGWIAEKIPNLVKEINRRGHEIASHGYNHKLLYEMSEHEFREDLQKSVGLLANILNERPSGYRAPNFSITDRSLQILSEENFKYDSSYFPSVLHDRYGKIEMDKNRNVSKFNELTEIPISVNPFLGVNLPWAGGGYFRVLPYSFFRAGVKSAISENGYYCFYLHSWEVDPDQPKVSGLSWTHQFRHYYGLKNTRTKLIKLLQDFDFHPVETILTV